jgi:acetyltransferase EpsM
VTIKIVGAGALAREVHAALTAMGHIVECFLVEPAFASAPIFQIPVHTNLQEAISDTKSQFVLAIGENAARFRIAATLGSASFLSVRHPAAVIGPRVLLRAGAMILGSGSMTTDIEIGTHALINPGCNLSHDCRIGAFASLGPGTSLAGGVSIEEGANLGVGVVVAPGCVVGAWSTVGAGAVVIRSVEPGTTVVGNPARPIVRKDRV